MIATAIAGFKALSAGKKALYILGLVIAVALIGFGIKTFINTAFESATDRGVQQERAETAKGVLEDVQKSKDANTVADPARDKRLSGKYNEAPSTE